MGPEVIEPSVMIDLFHPSVQMKESRDVLPVGLVDDVARLEVEPSGVELERLGKVGHATPNMAQLVNGRWCLLEPLCLVDGPMLVLGEVVLQLGQVR